MEKKVLAEEELPPHKRSHSPEEKSAESEHSEEKSSEDQEEVHSANNWEEAELGDDQRKAKFLRLMGAAKKEHKGRFVIGAAVSSKPHGRSSQEERNLEEKLESQFQHSLTDRLQHRNKKHRGLGFGDEATASEDAKANEERTRKEDTGERSSEKQ